MLSLIKKFENAIVVAIIAMMAVTIFFATIELGLFIIERLSTPPILLLDINDMLNIFGMFLLVLIGIELLLTIKTYIIDEKLRLDVVLTAAIMAVARKIIIIDPKELSPVTIIGIASITVALSVGYFLVKRTHSQDE